MKFKQIFILKLLVIVIAFSSCSSKASKRLRPPVAKIELQTKQLSMGDDLIVNVVVKPKSGELKQAELYLDDKLVHSSDAEQFSYTIKNIDKLGVHQIKVVSTQTNAQVGENYATFNVFSDTPPISINAKIVRAYPHGKENFTEGFEVHEGGFYESTGNHGASRIFQFNLNTGKAIKEVKLADKYFGEGMTVLNNKIYQLTYKAQKAFVYDLNSYALVDSFTYSTPEGWGLTNDGECLIKSSGSEYIDFVNPATYELERRIAVCDNKGPIKNINELEYHNGYIYANVWITNLLLKIDAQTGQVVAKADCSKFYDSLDDLSGVDVFNGIAIDDATGKMYVTGKYWDKIFEIELKAID